MYTNKTLLEFVKENKEKSGTFDDVIQLALLFCNEKGLDILNTAYTDPSYVSLYIYNKTNLHFKILGVYEKIYFSCSENESLCNEKLSDCVETYIVSNSLKSLKEKGYFLIKNDLISFYTNFSNKSIDCAVMDLLYYINYNYNYNYGSDISFSKEKKGFLIKSE
jgi:hypothetical protein